MYRVEMPGAWAGMLSPGSYGRWLLSPGLMRHKNFMVVLCQCMLVACTTQAGITWLPAPAHSRFTAPVPAVVDVSICIDGAGKLSHPPVIQRSSGNHRLDSAALRYVEKTSGYWKVGTKNGKPVPYCGVFPVRFEMVNRQPNLMSYGVLVSPSALPQRSYDPELLAQTCAQAAALSDFKISGPVRSSLVDRGNITTPKRGAAQVCACIDSAGTPTERPSILQSSGSETLDGAALRYAHRVSRDWRAELIGGKSVGYCAVLLVRFALQ